MGNNKIIHFLKSIVPSGIVAVFVANVLNKAVALASSMVITRVLSETDYGYWSYSLNFYSYLSLLSGLGLLSGAFQFGTENHDSNKENSYFKYCFIYGMLFNLFMVFAIIFGSFIYYGSIPAAIGFIRLISPLILIEFAFNLFLTIFRCDNKIKRYSIILIINTILVALGTCFGSFFSVYGIIVGRYIAFILTVAILLLFDIKILPRVFCAPRLDTDEKKPLWKFSLFTGFSAALNSLIYILDVTMVAFLLKDEILVGIYNVGTLIPNALAFIPSSILVAMLPQIIYNRDNPVWINKKLKKLFLLTGLFNLVVCALLVIFAPLAINLFFGDKYANSVPVFRLLCLGYLFSGTFRQLSTSILASFRRIYFNVFISCLSAVLDISVNIVFITTFKMGYIGAAYATLSVDIITALIAFGYLLYRLITKTYLGRQYEKAV